MQTTTSQLPFTDEQEELYEKIVARLDADRMKQLLADLVDIHSPTGGEREAVQFMTGHLRDVVGVPTAYQPISERTGNVHAELKGAGDGARLLLYAPIDTHIDPDHDIPWAAPALREDMVPKARIDGDLVFGLGASNPKCMVAGLTEVMHAVRESGVNLRGDLAVGFAGGGMPWSVGRRDAFGMSTGVYHLLNRGQYPDYCVILKPRWGVFPEEPGMGWFKVTVRGTFGYAGITRGTPGFRSSIVPAATMIGELESWLPKYTAANTSGSVLPEGWIAAVRSGDPEKPAFPSAATEIFLDVRISPRTSPAEVRHQFGKFMADVLRRHPDMEADWEMYGSLPGGSTPNDNWIVQSSQRGWEREAGEPYTEIPYQSGQTDGAMIRVLGVPTARVGYPWPPATTPPEFAEGLGGMGVASVDDVMKGVRVVAHAVVDTLTRSRAELGLPDALATP